MKDKIINKILSKQNLDGSWVEPSKFYTNKYKGTVWTLLVLAELDADKSDPRIKKACEFILNNSYEPVSGGFSVLYSTKYKSGLPSQVIPCLTGNMAYTLIKFGYLDDPRIKKAIEWIIKYQRADDGVYLSKPDPFHNKRKACFSKHTCFMGVVKCLKALSIIPKEKQTAPIKQKIEELSEFMLIHHLYKKSSDLSKVSKPGWLRFGFPLMYNTDVLELLDIFRELEIKDDRLIDAINLVESKSINNEWILEHTFNGRYITTIEKKGEPSYFLTERAKRVLRYYEGEDNYD